MTFCTKCGRFGGFFLREIEQGYAFQRLIEDAPKQLHPDDFGRLGPALPLDGGFLRFLLATLFATFRSSGFGLRLGSFGFCSQLFAVNDFTRHRWDRSKGWRLPGDS